MPAGPIPKVDPLKPQKGLAELATKVALTKPGTWFYSQVAARIDGPLVRLSGGRISSVAGLFPVVLLTARGARSGIERTVPLVYFTDGDDVILMASSFGRPKYPAWYHNVKANPDVRLEAMGDRRRLHRQRDRGGGARAPLCPRQAGLPRLWHLRGAHRRHPPRPSPAPEASLILELRSERWRARRRPAVPAAL